jgi:hypothetical protein
LSGAATDIENTIRPPDRGGDPKMRVMESKLGIIEVREVQCCFFSHHLSLQTEIREAASQRTLSKPNSGPTLCHPIVYHGMKTPDIPGAATRDTIEPTSSEKKAGP